MESGAEMTVSEVVDAVLGPEGDPCDRVTILGGEHRLKYSSSNARVQRRAVFLVLKYQCCCASAARRHSASPLDLRVVFHIPCASNMDSEPHWIISFNSLQHPS